MRPAGRASDDAPRAYLTAAEGEVHPLSHLPDRELQLIAGISQVRHYSKGTVVVEQGEPAKGLFVNRSALLRVAHVLPDGKRVAVGLLGPGQMVGLPEIILGTPHQRQCEVISAGAIEYLPKREIVRLILDNTNIAVEMLVQASHQLFEQIEELCQIPSSSSEERLLRSLQDFSATGEGVGKEIPMLTVQELADSIGCTRQWTSKILGEMEDRGLIRRHGRRITLTPKAHPGRRSLVPGQSVDFPAPVTS